LQNIKRQYGARANVVAFSDGWWTTDLKNIKYSTKTYTNIPNIYV
jgi:hypothetical protein